ncbi:armadillo-type protein [Mycena olivaceomarginata]|nr:armadillo-type protein [Mycena olivaceomarginata]
MRLLRDDWPSVAVLAMRALSKIACWPDGAAAVVDAGTLDPLLDEIFESTVGLLCSWTCVMLAELVRNQSTAFALLNCNPCRRLVALLRSDSGSSGLAIGDREITRTELALRALTSIAQADEGSHAVVEAGILNVLDELLGSSNSGVRLEACHLLGILALDDSTSSTILDMNPCRQLVSLLLDENATTAALCALDPIAESLKGAQAVIEAGILPVLYELLKSSHVSVRMLSCSMIGNLARLQPAVPSLWQASRCKMLVQLLRGDASAVACEAVHVLSRIVDSADGALAVVEAGTLQILDKLVQFAIPGVHQWTAVMLVTLIRHLCTTVAVLEANPSPKPVKLLRGKHPDVIGPASYALSSISKSLEGAQAVLDGGANSILDQLLESSETRVRRWSCSMLGNLARLQPTIPTLWTGSRCKMLLQLSRDDAPTVASKALYALSKIAYWAEGAVDVVEAGAVHILDELIETSDLKLRRGAVKLLIMLVRHPSSTAAVLVANPCPSLVALVSGAHPDVVGPASRALACISESVQGAQAVLEAGANSILDQLLESSDTLVRMWSCSMLGNLACLQPTAPTLWTGSRCKILVQFSRDDAPAVAGQALYALSKIAYWADGATAVIQAGAVYVLDELVESAIPGVHRWLAAMLAALVYHSSSTAAVLVANPCPSLVALLSGEHPDVVESASYALARISESVQGAQAVLEAGANSILNQLLESLKPDVQKEACCLLGNLAHYESTAPTTWQGKRCQKLIELSRDDAPDIAENAMYALTRIAYWPDGVIAVVEAGAFYILDKLVESAIPGVHWWIAVMLAALSSTTLAVLETNALPRPVALSRNAHPYIIGLATHALSLIAESSQGAQAVVEAGSSSIIDELLESSNTDVQRSICYLLGNLARYESTAPAAWQGNRCQKLIELSHDIARSVSETAMVALWNISYWMEATAVLVEAGVLRLLNEINESAILSVRKGTCALLENLARHPSTVPAVLAVNPIWRLVALLQ